MDCYNIIFWSVVKMSDFSNNETVDKFLSAVSLIADKVLSLENSHLHQDKPQVINEVLAIIKEVINLEDFKVQAE